MDLTIFQYITSTDELDAVWLLAHISNLLLTIIYIMLFYIAYKVVIRNIRKGRLD